VAKAAFGVIPNKLPRSSDAVESKANTADETKARKGKTKQTPTSQHQDDDEEHK
jgi:hypothetical protein